MNIDFNIIRQYNFPTVIRFGAGAINELAPHLVDNQLKRPLVVTDPNVEELEFFQNIIRQLTAVGLSVKVFSDIHKNPVKTDVLSGGTFYKESDRDSIIGIGGGAAMDVARAIALHINHPRDLFDY